MTIIIGGHEQGLLDSSATLLKRDGRTAGGVLPAGAEAYANAANGNVVVQGRDAFLASQGAGLSLVRTYNAQGNLRSDESDASGGGWRF